ncbi:MAG: hypothetical protein AB4040_18370 [Synechococcus sp.]
MPVDAKQGDSAMKWLRYATFTAGVAAGAIACSSPAMAGKLTVSPTVQNSVNVQNAQQVQLGYGVDRQEAVLIQDQSQTQVRNGRVRSPNQPRGPRHNGETPIEDDIEVTPTVQNAVGVQNGQQVQLALPDIRPARR